MKKGRKNGPYTSLQDFLNRIHDRALNKKSLEALICSGAFDNFEERGQMYENIENLLAYNKEQIAGKEANQDSLFGGISEVNKLEMRSAESATATQMLLWEKELLGVYVSGHPLDAHADEVAKRPTIEQIKKGYQGTTIVTTGLIDTVKELLTKKGDKMAFVKLSDQVDSIEMVAFPETYNENRELLEPGTCVAIKGKFNIRNEEPSILINKIKPLSETAKMDLPE